MPKFEQPQFPYAATPERERRWEQPFAVVNAMHENGMPTLQESERELSARRAVDIDNRALLAPECVSVCYGRPHAGEYVPQELWERADPNQRHLLAVVDRGTDYIFRHEQVPSVGTKISRWVIDPNRPPLPAQKTAGSKAPGSVLWQVNPMTEESLYRRAPSEQEITDLSEQLYLPYYNAMMSVIGSQLDRRTYKQERTLVLDGHSFMTNDEFAGYFKKYGVTNYKELPLFIVGDRDGEACDADIKHAFIAALETAVHALPEVMRKRITRGIEADTLVGDNVVLKGVHNVQFYGQRAQGVNALQLEINEGAYTDTDQGYYTFDYDREALEAMRRIIAEASKAVDPLLKQ